MRMFKSKYAPLNSVPEAPKKVEKCTKSIFHCLQIYRPSLDCVFAHGFLLDKINSFDKVRVYKQIKSLGKLSC